MLRSQKSGMARRRPEHDRANASRRRCSRAKWVRSVSRPRRNTFCGRSANSFSSGTKRRNSTAMPTTAPPRTTRAKTRAATNVSPVTSPNLVGRSCSTAATAIPVCQPGLIRESAGECQRSVRSAQSGSRFSAKARGPSSWSGWPHIETSSRGAGPARVGEAQLERAPQRPLGRGHRRGRVLGDLLGQVLRLLAQPLGRVDDLADHAELVGPLAPTCARGGRRTPCASPPRPASCASGRSPRCDTTWPIETCGSKNWASDAAITMSASATQWKPPPAQMPLTAVITGFHTSLVPRGEVQVEVLDRLAVALHAHAVGGDLGDVDAGLERAPLAGVHDHPHLGVGVELRPRQRELVAHRARSSR